jgi:hypothetical protein
MVFYLVLEGKLIYSVYSRIIYLLLKQCKALHQLLYSF